MTDLRSMPAGRDAADMLPPAPIAKHPASTLRLGRPLALVPAGTAVLEPSLGA
jgi:hypothetical protein